MSIIQTWIDYLDCTGHDLTPLILGCGIAIICLFAVFILLLTEKSAAARNKKGHEVLDYQKIIEDSENEREPIPAPIPVPAPTPAPTTPEPMAQSVPAKEPEINSSDILERETRATFSDTDAFNAPSEETEDGGTVFLNPNEDAEEGGTVFLGQDEGRIITLTNQADTLKEYRIRLTPSATIGRVFTKNTLAFPDEKSVSTVHCRVYTEGDHVYVSDLNSTNHTFVDNVQIDTPTELKAGSILRLGSLRLIVGL